MYDPSEFECLDEDLGVEFQEYLQEAPMTEDELDGGSFLSVSDGAHMDLWDDLDQVNEDDIPY